MKVLCIGEALIDMICTDRGSRLADGQNFLKKAGGAPANVAAAIAALGGQVDMAAKVGKDPFGQHLIDLLGEMGVHTKWVIQDPNSFTTFAFVFVRNAAAAASTESSPVINIASSSLSLKKSQASIKCQDCVTKLAVLSGNNKCL